MQTFTQLMERESKSRWIVVNELVCGFELQLFDVLRPRLDQPTQIDALFDDESRSEAGKNRSALDAAKRIRKYVYDNDFRHNPYGQEPDRDWPEGLTQDERIAHVKRQFGLPDSIQF